MYCKYCGRQIDDDSTFCKYCGKSLSGDITSSTPKDEKQRIELSVAKPRFTLSPKTQKYIFIYILWVVANGLAWYFAEYPQRDRFIIWSGRKLMNPYAFGNPVYEDGLHFDMDYFGGFEFFIFAILIPFLIYGWYKFELNKKVKVFFQDENP